MKGQDRNKGIIEGVLIKSFVAGERFVGANNMREREGERQRFL